MKPIGNNRHAIAPRCGPRRVGTLLVSVLVCLSLMMVLFAAMVRTTALARQQVRLHESRVQAEYLADSAIERACAQLAVNREYAGETWRIAAGPFAAQATAAVEIHVETLPERPDARRVKVTSRYPDESTVRARHTKEITVALRHPGESP